MTEFADYQHMISVAMGHPDKKLQEMANLEWQRYMQNAQSHQSREMHEFRKWGFTQCEDNVKFFQIEGT